jgi:hypothetical protein
MLLMFIGLPAVADEYVDEQGLHYSLNDGDGTATVTRQTKKIKVLRDKYSVWATIGDNVEVKYFRKETTSSELDEPIMAEMMASSNMILLSEEAEGDDVYFALYENDIMLPDFMGESETGYYSTTSYYIGEGDINAYTNESYLIPESITVGEKSYEVTAIEERAFYGECLFASDIMAGLGSNAYRRYPLKTIVLPSTLKTIGDYAFYADENIVSITCKAETVPAIGDYVFSGSSEYPVFYVPSSSLDSYKKDWGIDWYTVQAIPVDADDKTVDYLHYALHSDGTASVTQYVQKQQNDLYYRSNGALVKTLDDDIEVRYYNSYGDDMTASVKSMEDMYEGSMAADIYIVLMKNEEAVDYNGTSYGLGPGVIKKVESSSLSDLPEAEFTDDVTSIAGYSMEEYKITTINLINSYTVPEKIEVDNAKYTVTAIEEGAFYECPATEISLPSTLETIGKKAFYKSSVTSIDFSSTKITSIAEETFYESKIETISLPSALESIGDRGFYRSCLKSIDLSKTKITSIGKEVFCNNSDAAFMLETVILPPNLETIGYMSFAYTGIKSIVIPSSVTSIGEYAFWNSSYLQSIEIPSSVTSIGKYAFGMCNCLTGFVLPEKVTSINAGVFSWCNGLTKIEISGQVTSIGDNAFIQCSKMEKVSLPSSVESIGSSAFSGCSSLTSIELPSTVTSIGDKAFYNTKNVVTITCESEIAPTLGGADVFTNSSASILKVPAAAATSYKTTQYWADFTYTSDYITDLSFGSS